MASQACDSQPPSPCDFVDHEQEDSQTTNPALPSDAIRMVGIRKVAGEHLVRTSPVHSDLLPVFTHSLHLICSLSPLDPHFLGLLKPFMCSPSLSVPTVSCLFISSESLLLMSTLIIIPCLSASLINLHKPLTYTSV